MRNHSPSHDLAKVAKVVLEHSINFALANQRHGPPQLGHGSTISFSGAVRLDLQSRCDLVEAEAVPVMHDKKTTISRRNQLEGQTDQCTSFVLRKCFDRVMVRRFEVPEVNDVTGVDISRHVSSLCREPITSIGDRSLDNSNHEPTKLGTIDRNELRPPSQKAENDVHDDIGRFQLRTQITTETLPHRRPDPFQMTLHQVVECGFVSTSPSVEQLSRVICRRHVNKSSYSNVATQTLTASLAPEEHLSNHA